MGRSNRDYEKRVSGFVLANPESKNAAAAAVQAMTAADLNRFLVICAVVSDLYCPGYNPRQSLASLSASKSSIGKRVRLRIGPTFRRCGFMVPKSLKPASFA
jgi:hypothetical protein